MATTKRIRVNCPDGKWSLQGTRVVLAGWWSAGQFFRAGETTIDVDEPTFAALTGEVARGESALTVTDLGPAE